MAEDSFNVAVYGASGALGREVLLALEGEGLPIAGFTAVAAARSAGEDVAWRGRPVGLRSAAEVDLDALDAAVVATPPEAAAGLVPALLEAGVLVVDCAPRSAPAPLPLVWPTLNGEALPDHPGGFRVPCATAAALGPLLAALARLGAVREVEATALLGATAAGRVGEDALSRQTVGLLSHKLVDPGPFGAVLAFNAIPGSARRGEDGEDAWEDETAAELRDLVPGLAGRPLRLGAVQVPVFVGHGVAVTVRLDATPSRDEVLAALDARADLLRVPGRLAVRDALEVDEVMVGQVRVDDDGVIRCFLAVDALHRTAGAVGALLARVVAEDLW